MLEDVLEKLPARARAEFKQLLDPLDAAYSRRTLPDPFARRRRWRTQFWWHRRLAGGWETA
ncbi:hypothetical protein AB0D12_01445 [Streptomyces sp. NPDC048479]|uniref:hypothetical protein n=1 Tax=Streptomyces sp. NPDC048479 TaxID=3154725 RepID=UPI00344880FD